MLFKSDSLVQLISSEVEQEGCDLVELKVKGNSSRPLVQVYVDRDGGVNIDTCARITRKLTELLDISYPDLVQYRLEVSSPGVERPLKTQKDFYRNTGRIVRIRFLENDNVRDIEGEIQNADANTVYVRSEDLEIQIPYESIQLARIQLRW